MEKSKKSGIFRYHVIKLIVSTVLAILVFIFRETLVINIRYYIASLMFLYFAEELLFEILFSKKKIFKKDKFFMATVDLIFSLTLFIAPIEYEIVCIIWACWSISREMVEIKEIFTELKSLPAKIISGVESITVIVFSIMLILEPGEHHALIHTYLLMVELITNAFVLLLDELLVKEEEIESKIEE